MLSLEGNKMSALGFRKIWACHVRSDRLPGAASSL